jgi:hypothetical protein
MDYKEFFISDNKSGWKTNERLLHKNFPEVYAAIQTFALQHKMEGLSFKEKVWYFINDIKTQKRCICGKSVNFRGTLQKGFNEFCSQSCFNGKIEENTKRVKKTNQEKYGVDFFSQHKLWEDKTKTTKKERYGSETFNNPKKMMQTKRKKYGNPTYNNLDKRKKTNKERYGVEQYAQSDRFKDQMKEVFYSREGFDVYNFIKEKDTKHFCTFICASCGNEVVVHKQVFRERHAVNNNPCIICFPLGVANDSSPQRMIFDILERHQVAFEKNKRGLLKGKQEIDAYLPQQKLGIECNGVYHHNELFVEPDFHLNKTLAAEQNDVHLIHFFDDEIILKPSIVESIILNKIGLTPNKVFGRKTVLQELDNKTYKAFIEANHIQGYAKASIRLGLFSNGELISVMSFGMVRKGIGKYERNVYEMVRFANKIFTTVHGAANKLFQYFLETYKPTKVITMADRRIFNGDAYLRLGFKKVSHSLPNYWYVINGRRFHRLNFTKAQLKKEGFDVNGKTEKEIMFERKIYRIYDCGVIKYVWSLEV